MDTEPSGSGARTGSRTGLRNGRRRPPAAAVVALTGTVAAVLLLLLGGGAPQPVPAGLPDPGPLVGWGLPLVDLLGVVAAVGVVAALLAPLLSMRAPVDELGGASLRSLRRVRPLALAWAGLSLAEAVLTVADQFAVPLTRLDPSFVATALPQSDQGVSSLVQAALAVVLALASRWVLTGREVGVLLGAALLAVLPPLFTGHSAASGSHDLAVVSIVVHVLAAVVWVGGVLALWQWDGSAERRERAARRFSSLAAWCFALTAVSGLVGALVRLGSLEALVSSGYGAGVLAKTAVLLVVGAIALQARRWALAGQVAAPSRWSLTRVTALEAAVMGLALGLGAALSRTPPPVGERYVDAAEAILGGPLPPAPDLDRVLWSFQPSGVGILVVGLGLTAYLMGVRTLQRRGRHWPLGRTVSWLAGLLVVAWCTIGGLGVYAHALFSAHMLSHMLLSMVAPVLLVVGAPITLALNALPGADVPGGQGPRQLLAGALRSRPLAVLSHPATATVLFVGSLYGVYFSGFFDWLMTGHLGHAWMEVHFLLVGYLFFEQIVGIAPLPRRLPYLGRLALVLLVAPMHAFFSVALIDLDPPVGESFYASLQRPWAQDLAADQALGGQVSWAIGEVPMVLVAVILLFQWWRSDSRAAARHDRREDSSEDAELKAYNDMLARVAEADRRQG